MSWPVGVVCTCVGGRGRGLSGRGCTHVCVRVDQLGLYIRVVGCWVVGVGYRSDAPPPGRQSGSQGVLSLPHWTPVGVVRTCGGVLSGRGRLRVRHPSTWPPVRVTGHQLGLYVRVWGGLTSRGWMVDESGSATGQMPLHLAASQGHKACCLSLIGHQLGLYVRGGEGGLTSRGWGVERSGSATGQTPLHLAASQGHKACCLSLIGHHASVTVHDNVTKATPIHLAGAYEP